MIQKKFFFRKQLLNLFIGLFAFGMVVSSCGGGDNNDDTSEGETTEQPATGSGPSADDMEDAAASSEANAGKGVGPFADKAVTIPAAIDEAMAAKGKATFEAKCTACHKLTEERYVGPGLKGVTERRKPEWIMNMIVNPGEMLEKDPTAKELLAVYMTQMAKQDVTEQDARDIYEYFRQNDKK